jgi:hypothetical protein
MKSRENPPHMLTIRDRINVKGPENKWVVYQRLLVMVEVFISQVRNSLDHGRLTWHRLENTHIHVSLVLYATYAVVIVAHRIGKPELRQSVAYLA